jgi:hypothetical protein
MLIKITLKGVFFYQRYQIVKIRLTTTKINNY